MAENFYTLAETAEKLGKSENEVKEMVKNGDLREYRDGSAILFKTDDVDKLAVGDIDLLSDEDENLDTGPAETGEISLASTGSELDIDEDIFSMTDTSSQTGPQGSSINILGESDADYKISDDTRSDTQSLKISDSGEAKIEDDVNLDSFGSGSGLLDLSLQADDTSLGADVLEDIYSADAAEDQGGGALEMAAEADEILGPGGSSKGGSGTGVVEEAPAEAAIDPLTGVYSTVLIVGMIVMIYTAIVALAGAQGIAAFIVTALAGGFMVWYVMGGLLVLTLAIVGIGAAMSGKPARSKAPKAKKAGKNRK